MSDDCPKCPPEGAPLWLATFADLMSLLMCFFVLLLSFATMDKIRFKKMADSMKDAFGVQREVPAYEPPMGVSIIAQHFSPAPTEPTPMEEIRQTTEERQHLKIPEDIDASIQIQTQQQQQVNTQQLSMIKQHLDKEMKQGLVTVESEASNIIIRIEDKGSFPSASADLKPGFMPVMKKIAGIVAKSEGRIVVAGHTDNIPISDDWYRSNWELSASRAVTVAQYIMRNKQVKAKNIIVEGHAETKPLVPNTSAKNRSKNRRVEVILKNKYDDPNRLINSREQKGHAVEAVDTYSLQSKRFDKLKEIANTIKGKR